MTEGACEVAGTTDQRSTAKHKSVANAAFTTVLKVSIGSARLPVCPSLAWCVVAPSCSILPGGIELLYDKTSSPCNPSRPCRPAETR